MTSFSISKGETNEVGREILNYNHTPPTKYTQLAPKQQKSTF